MFWLNCRPCRNAIDELIWLFIMDLGTIAMLWAGVTTVVDSDAIAVAPVLPELS